MQQDPQYQWLSSLFLKAMNEIGQYGEEKYKEKSFQRNPTRDFRKSTAEIGNHIRQHYEDCRLGLRHDHFGTRRHQLAAVAYNAMMEFVLAGLEQEE